MKKMFFKGILCTIFVLFAINVPFVQAQKKIKTVHQVQKKIGFQQWDGEPIEPDVTLQNGEKKQVFYFYGALDEALDAAENGDTIILSIGYHSLEKPITKAVKIYGSGCKDLTSNEAPDYNKRTRIPNLEIDLPLSESELLLDGIYCNKLTCTSLNGNFAISRCEIDNINLKNCDLDRCTIKQSRIASLKSESCLQDGFMLKNCVVRSFSTDQPSSTGPEFQNCIVESTQGGFLWNSILLSRSYSNGHPSAAYYSIISVNKTWDYETNTYVGYIDPSILNQNCYGYTGYPRDLFIEDYGWNLSGTFELTPEAQLNYLGDDGTQVGIYGGSEPYTEIPSIPVITSIDISEDTLSELVPIHFEVKSSQPTIACEYWCTVPPLKNSIFGFLPTSANDVSFDVQLPIENFSDVVGPDAEFVVLDNGQVVVKQPGYFWARFQNNLGQWGAIQAKKFNMVLDVNDVNRLFFINDPYADDSDEWLVNSHIDDECNCQAWWIWSGLGWDRAQENDVYFFKCDDVSNPKNSLSQPIVNLPAGRYLLTANGRVNGNAQMEMSIEGQDTSASVSFPSAGQGGDSWNQQELIFTTNGDPFHIFVRASGEGSASITAFELRFATGQAIPSALNVIMPAEVDMNNYENMSLVLTDGQSRKVVTTTKRRNYLFSGLRTNKRYNLTLQNDFGQVFAFIENISIGEGNNQLILDKLKVPVNPSVRVVDVDDHDVTDQVDIRWYNSQEQFVAEGSSITFVPEGEKLFYEITLPQSLGNLYVIPQRQETIAKKETIVLKLSPLPQITLTGRVTNIFGSLAGANVSILQQINGRYATSYNVTTSEDGRFTIEVKDDSTTIHITCLGHKSLTFQMGGMTGHTDLGTLRMEQLTGIVVVPTVMKQQTTVDDTETLLPISSDKVFFEIWNESRRQSVTTVSDQGRIFITDGALAGDEILICVKELCGEYDSDSVRVTIPANDTINISLTLRELPSLTVTYESSENIRNIGCLYDAKGWLVESGQFSQHQLQLSHLPIGSYTFVAMAENQIVGTLTSLNALSQLELHEGIDYVCSSIDLMSGEKTNIHIPYIPPLSQSSLQYTNPNGTYLLSNKLSMSQGSIVTLSSRITFLPAASELVSNVSLIVSIPKGCRLLENSVLIGNKVASYNLSDDGQLTIPFNPNDIGERVRFCVIPIESGNYQLTGYANFSLLGLQKQYVGCANFEATALNIDVLDVVRNMQFDVSGVASENAQVEVYVDNALSFKCQANSSGKWNGICVLPCSPDPSVHSVYARIVTTNGDVITTNINKVLYDTKTSTKPLGIEMSFYNGWYKRTIETYVDIENGKVSPNQYPFFTTTDITFVVNLNDNSRDAAEGVNIIIDTNDNYSLTLPATYDEKMGRWIAVHTFSSSSLPCNLDVEVVTEPIMEFDEGFSQSKGDNLKETLEILKQQCFDMQQATDKLLNALDNNDYTEANSCLPILQKAYEGMFSNSEFDEELAQRLDALSDEEFLPYIDNLFSEIEKQLEELGADKIFNLNWNINSHFTENGFLTPSLQCVSSRPDTDWTTMPSGDWTSNFEFDGNKISIILKNKPTGDQLFAVFPLPAGSRASAMELNSTNWLKLATDYFRIISEVVMRKSLGKTGKMNKAESIGQLSNNIKTIFNKLIIKKKASGIKSQDRTWITRYSKQLKRYEALFALKLVDAAVYLNDIKEAAEQLGEIAAAYMEYEDLRKDISKHFDGTEQCQKKWRALEKKIDDYKKERIDKCAELFFLKCLSSSLSYIVPMEKSYQLSAPIMEFFSDIWVDNQIVNADIRNRHIQQQLRMEAYNSQCHKIEKKKKKRIRRTDTEFVPILDPSGYVYEAVLSNRLADVKTTVFEKQKDGRPLMWQAENYCQKNPLYTDQDGFYTWDVPTGWWQVRYEKSGYETTTSEWLPVPPPQLEVNMALTQSVAPEVLAVKGYNSGVKVRMSKYMKPESFNENSITVLRNGQTVAGKVIMLNEEEDPYNATRTYASMVKFVPETIFNTTDHVVMTIHHEHPLSYCDMQMAEDYTTTVQIEPEIQAILVDSLYDIDYLGVQQIEVSVVPAQAGFGHHLLVKSASDIIVESTETEVEIGSDGKAIIQLVGHLPGTTAIRCTIDNDSDVQATALVRVNLVEQPETDAISKPYYKRQSPSIKLQKGVICIDDAVEGWVRVCDITGRLLATRHLHSLKEQLPLPSHTKGLIIVHIDMPNSQTVAKKFAIR